MPENIPAYEAVATFLEGLFDYAGMFPPASLPLAQALAEYRRHVTEPDRWMIGPFVCKVSMLDDLAVAARLSPASAPIRLSLIGSRSVSSHGFLDSWESDVASVGRLVREASARLVVDAFEVRLPDDATDSPGSVRALLDTALERLCELGPPTPAVYFEVARDAEFERRLRFISSALIELRDAAPASGLKLRCGGMHEEDFPSPEEVATFLSVAIDADHRFKATAGLHHPVRHWNPGQGVRMHGFLNVFFAAALYAAGRADRALLTDIIADEEARNFRFIDDGLEWRTLGVSIEELRRVRHNLAQSIGSCSFDEPRTDLAELGWLLPSDQHS